MKEESVPWLILTVLVSFWIGLGVGLVYVGAAVLKVSALNLAILLVLFVTSYMWGGGTMHSLQPTGIAGLGVLSGFLALYVTSPLHSSPAVWPWFVFVFLALGMFWGFVELLTVAKMQIFHWFQFVAMTVNAAIPIALGAWWLQATPYRRLAVAYGIMVILCVLAGGLVVLVELRKRKRAP